MTESAPPGASSAAAGAPGGKRRIRVLIVDDSALVRQILSEILRRDPLIEVVGVAGDAHVAREKIKKLNPDVLTLDVEMPKMDGITFLRNLMRLRPMPVVMVSSLTERGADVTLDALALGAVDYLLKPRLDVATRLRDYADELVGKVKAAAGVSVRALEAARSRPSTVPPRLSTTAVLPRIDAVRPLRTTERIVAIGASTGGTEAIKYVLAGLPPDAPGILIAQHIPRAFSAAFARRMNDSCQLTVSEAEDGQQVLPGHVYIAPGDRHLLLTRDGTRYVCRLDDGAAVNRHKPSVDVLFRSVAQNAGRNAVGMLLTGMGRDGAQGLAEMRAAGSITLAQDEASSIVWGMPGEAVAIGAVQQVLPLQDMAAALCRIAAEMDITRASGNA